MLPIKMIKEKNRLRDRVVSSHMKEELEGERKE